MTAILKSIDDPRGALEKTRRVDLIKFARKQGMTDINWDMPAILICKKLRSRGISHIPGISYPVLGQPPNSAMAAPQVVAETGQEIDAEADLERQFASQQAQPKPTAQMSINELGAEMKRLGIKRDRRDNMITLRAKIEAHGRG